MKYILGRKLNMTQLFDESGVVTPVTAIVAMPNTVTKVKTVESDGYNAVQLATEDQKVSRVSKALSTSLGGKAFKVIQEIRHDEAPTATAGEEVTVASFEKGDAVTVSGTSKSKGFQGVVKRYNFKGGPRSHGQKHSERERGSSGGGPGRAGGRVVKGMRMPGRTGGDTVTVKGLKVVAVDIATNTIYISGAVPGRRGTVVRITA
ncbi:MAG: 50S ribosomal protein L3 [Candidatus Pacebacteria bacterium]|nr:50S ribosomal protein L3 [Candidatus Paceibacterota bacterium]